MQTLRPLLDELVDPSQSSFIYGRKGMDNVILMNEILHSFWRRKRKYG